jgi:glutamate/tyrosine decarboxylase-like PLP-dependent enzyme
MKLQKQIIKEFHNITEEYIENMNADHVPVVNYKNPKALAELIDFEIQKNGTDESQLIKLIKQYLEYAVNTGNRQFFNQLYGGFNLPAFFGEVLSALTNTSMYTYEVAPVATLIEAEMIKKMCKITGYQNGDGIFVTGGSNANLVAMFSARNKLYPNIKAEGIYGLPKLSVFTSDQAHYSLETNANLLGIGTKQIYKIKTDENGRMIPEELEKEIINSIQKNEKPFFISATAATTMLGAFDPFEQIAEIAEKHAIWFHVDGSFGASLQLTSKTKHLFKGIEKSDSLAWNPHKLMNIPLICSVILVNHKQQLYKNLTDLDNDYIFHETETASCDLGKKSVQCGRRVDALKLWLAWKYYGDKAYADHIDNQLHAAEYFEKKVKADKHLELLAPRQSLTVCFRYITKSGISLNKGNENIREALRKSGKSIVNYGYINNEFAFRWVVANAQTQTKDIDRFFDNFMSIAKKLNL